MPLYEFQCKTCGGVMEVLRPARKYRPPLCEKCGGGTCKIPSAGLIQFSGAPRPHDRAKDIWEGTPLEDSDGINRVHHVSEKIQVDHGAA